GRREDDGGRTLAQELQHLEAGKFRHLNVEEDEIRAQLLGKLHGLEAIRGLPDDLDLRDLHQMFAQYRACEHLVIYDQHTHGFPSITLTLEPVGHTMCSCSRMRFSDALLRDFTGTCRGQ